MSEDQIALREELRQRFPAEAGFKVEEAVWVELIDGRQVSTQATIVSGNGFSLTFRAKEREPLAERFRQSLLDVLERHRRSRLH